MSNLDQKKIAELHSNYLNFSGKKIVYKPKATYKKLTPLEQLLGKKSYKPKQKYKYKEKLAILDPENRKELNKYVSPFQEPKELTAEDIADKINSKEAHISYSVLKDLPETKETEFSQELLDAVIQEIKKQKLDMRDIKNMPLNMNDMRWHGSGGANQFETAQPTTNPAIFTVANTPKYIVMNGFLYFSQDGSYTYASNSITINAALVPPAGSSVQSFY